MYVNKYILEPLRKVFTDLCNKGLLHEIKTFGGCWIVRDVRGHAGLLSIHAFGLACDFNTDQNPLGWSREKCIASGLTPFTEEFVQVWRDNGWKAGADFQRFDLMHFEYTKDFNK